VSDFYEHLFTIFPPRRGLATSGRYARLVGPPRIYPIDLETCSPFSPFCHPSAAYGHYTAGGGSDRNEKLGRCWDLASFGTRLLLRASACCTPAFSSPPFIYRMLTRTYGVFVKHAARFLRHDRVREESS
jgi:hypothetical protein